MLQFIYKIIFAIVHIARVRDSVNKCKKLIVRYFPPIFVSIEISRLGCATILINKRQVDFARNNIRLIRVIESNGGWERTF